MAPQKSISSINSSIIVSKSPNKIGLNKNIIGESPVNSVRGNPEMENQVFLRNGKKQRQFMVENHGFEIDDDYNSIVSPIRS